jgi:hypothetical protein
VTVVGYNRGHGLVRHVYHNNWRSNVGRSHWRLRSSDPTDDVYGTYVVRMNTSSDWVVPVLLLWWWWSVESRSNPIVFLAVEK